MENIKARGILKADRKIGLRKLLIFGGISLLAISGYFLYNRYFISNARYARQIEKQYEVYQQFANRYQGALTNDTYGGKTPEETLRLLAEALKKDDLVLASKYFVLREDGQIDPQWQKGLQKTKEAGMLAKTIEVLPQLTYDAQSSSPETSWYILKNNKGDVQYSVILKLNKYSQIWKIESL